MAHTRVQVEGKGGFGELGVAKYRGKSGEIAASGPKGSLHMKVEGKRGSGKLVGKYRGNLKANVESGNQWRIQKQVEVKGGFGKVMAKHTYESGKHMCRREVGGEFKSRWKVKAGLER